MKPRIGLAIGNSTFVLLQIRCSPENMLAMAAIIKLITTPGPATVFATMPATKYIPVPTQLPTPSDVRSNVVRHF